MKGRSDAVKFHLAYFRTKQAYHSLKGGLVRVKNVEAYHNVKRRAMKSLKGSLAQ